MRNRAVAVSTLSFLSLLAFSAAGVFFPAPAAAAPGSDNPGQQAKDFQGSVMSRYNDKKFKEAAELIEDFIPKFPTNENVPANYVRLAHCYAESGQWDKFDAPLDECIKKFHGSRHWLFAWAFKLDRLTELKDADKFLDAAEAMIRKNGEVPTTLGFIRRNRYNETNDPTWILVNWPEFFRAYSVGSPLGIGESWGRDMLKVCTTPEQANRALKLVDKLLSKKPHEIPLDWQYIHAALLLKAGQKEKADQVMQGYVDLLEKDYKDYRVISLLDRWAELNRSLKDEKAVAAAVQKIMTDYPTCSSSADPLYDRLMELGAAKRYEEFLPLARHFVKTFPNSYAPRTNAGSDGGLRWMRLIALESGAGTSTWFKLAGEAAQQGNPRPATDLLALVEELEKGKSPYLPEGTALAWKYRLNMLLAKYPEAAKFAEQLVSDPQWSAGNFNMLVADAAKNDTIKAVVAAARTKRGVPEKDPKSPAAALLATLDGHLKDEKERMAEEVVTEMWDKHKNDAHTIEAVSKMAGYYFKKVKHEERDRWANRMIEAYPQHPLTQGVFDNQVRAETGQRNYDRVGAIIDTASQRFPGAAGDWVDARVGVYLAAKDLAGASKCLRGYLAKRLDAGDPIALDRVHRAEIQSIRNFDEKAGVGEWMSCAKKMAGTPSEILCNIRTYQYALENAYYDSKRAQWEPALAAARFLRSQTLDPEVNWQTQFAEVNTLAFKGDTPAMVKAIDEQLKDGKQRDLALRMEMPRVGSALGKLPKPEEGMAVAKRIAGVCVTPRDSIGLSLLQGYIWAAAEKYASGSPHFLAAIYADPNPATLYPILKYQALRGLNVQQYAAEVQKFIKESPSAQDVIPDLLYKWYHEQPDSKLAARKLLTDKYPASEARDTVQDEIDKANQPKPKVDPKKDPKKPG